MSKFNYNFKDDKKYDKYFIFSIGDMVVFLKDELNGWYAPDLTKEIYFIKHRNFDKNNENIYYLKDIQNLNLTWIDENKIRKANKQDVENFKFKTEINKYNL